MKGRRPFLTVAAAVGLWVVWSSLGRGMPTASAQESAGPTVIAMGGDAAGFFDRVQEFTWSLDANADPSSMEIRPGQSCQFQTTIKATRCLSSQTDQIGVRGKICVANLGGAPTQ